MSALLARDYYAANHLLARANSTLPGTQRHYRDWKTDTVCWMSLKRLRNLRDTFFYQVAYMMGIDRIDTMLSLSSAMANRRASTYEEYDGLLQPRMETVVHKSSSVSGRYHLCRHRAGY